MKKRLAAAMLLLAMWPWLQPPAARLAAAQGSGTADLVPVEIASVGIDPRSATPIVLLREPESGEVVPIWVGDAEARAIALALNGVDVPRPMTHDLMAMLLEELQATVEEVLVHDIVANTYLGTIRVRLPGDGGLRDVDSRPSDALALALRTAAPIRVARKILESSPAFDFVAPDGPEQIVQLLGVTVVTATPELRRKYALGNRSGVVVTRVDAHARKHGLKAGDLIVLANARPLRGPMDFFEAVRTTPAGGPVRLVVARPGEELDIELPSDTAPASETPGDRFRL